MPPVADRTPGAHADVKFSNIPSLLLNFLVTKTDTRYALHATKGERNHKGATMTSVEPDHPEGPGSKLGEKLRFLRDLRRRSDGSEYTQQEIADGVSELYWKDKAEKKRAELTTRCATEAETQEAMARFEAERRRPLVHRAYISQLLNGEGDNPTMDKLTYLAQFFGVPVGYFFDDEAGDQVAAELKELKDLRDLLSVPEAEREGVLALARTAAALPTRARQHILQTALKDAEMMRGLTQEGDN